jgi:hypothetical protein
MQDDQSDSGTEDEAMQAHRFRHHLEEMQRRSQAPFVNPNSFLMCPIPMGASAPDQSLVQQLYQRAFEEAQAIVRPSWLERDPLGTWN